MICEFTHYITTHHLESVAKGNHEVRFLENVDYSLITIVDGALIYDLNYDLLSHPYVNGMEETFTFSGFDFHGKKLEYAITFTNEGVDKNGYDDCFLHNVKKLS